jgi:hypothetical protein
MSSIKQDLILVAENLRFKYFYLLNNNTFYSRPLRIITKVIFNGNFIFCDGILMLLNKRLKMTEYFLERAK